MPKEFSHIYFTYDFLQFMMLITVSINFVYKKIILKNNVSIAHCKFFFFLTDLSNQYQSHCQCKNHNNTHHFESYTRLKVANMKLNR